MSELTRTAKADENYRRMRAELDEILKGDKQLAAIAEKIKAGKATFSDTAKYSEIVAKHLSGVIQGNIGAIHSPLGLEYVCKTLLADHYDAINDVLGDVQAVLDEKNGIHIRPQKAAYPAERVQQVAHSLVDPTVAAEVIARRAAAPVENVAKSMHDDYMQENAAFRSRAGLKCWIVRQTDGKCCPWCSSIAGRYVYGEEPQDVYRRHDNCGCTVTYECGRQRQDVWSKRSWEVPEITETARPTIFSREEGRRLVQKALNRLTLARRRGKNNGDAGIDYMSNSFRPIFSKVERQLLISGGITIPTRVVENSSFHLLADVFETKRSKAVKLVEKNLRKIQGMLPDDFEMPQIAVVDFARHGLNPDAIGGYHAQSGIMFINSQYDTPQKILAFVTKHKGFFADTTEFAPLLHELGHKYYEDSVKMLAKLENIEYNSAKNRIDSAIYSYIHARNSNGRFVLEQISGYADIGYSDNNYTELIAECFSVATTNETAADILKILRGEVL